MRELLYEDMTPAQAADALDAFVAERAPALEQPRSTMATHGLDPDVLLEATPESVGPVWEWITTRSFCRPYPSTAPTSPPTAAIR